MIIKTYKDFYKRPYHSSKYGSWVLDSKGHFVFQFEYRWTDKGDYEPIFKKLTENIIDVLNSDKKLEGSHIFRKEGIYIYMDNDPKPVITIRGWGQLTGIGGYRLPAEEAVNVQDTFGDFIIEKLNS